MSISQMAWFDRLLLLAEACVEEGMGAKCVKVDWKVNPYSNYRQTIEHDLFFLKFHSSV